MPRCVTATYRLQLSREFPFAAAREHVGYFDALGVSHLYLSPVLCAKPGSAHGYDVIDHARVNPELGSEEEFLALADDLHARGMGIILDIVPNHMSASAENPYWDDVLQRGRSSRYADWFDIDWDAPRARGKVILPVLAEELDRVLERDEVRLRIRDSGARVAYTDKTFPLDPSTLPQEIQLAQLDPAGRPAAEAWASGTDGRTRLRLLLDAQNYRLRCWRRAQDEINYRRFFDVTDLVSLRMESEEIFHATHKRILEWVRAGVLDGLRVDHVDGLRTPEWYLARLRSGVEAVKHPDAPTRFPILVEKILLGDEQLPSDWPVDGTTGYDFLNDVQDLFLDPAGFAAIEASYRRLRHNPTLDFDTVARQSKRIVLRSALRADVTRLARLARAWRPSESLAELAAAIVEVIAQLDVYRTYIGEPGLGSESDTRRLATAFRGARAQEGVSATALAALEAAFFAAPTPSDRNRAELVMRLQQLSGPAAAKGVEDTALYAYMPLASRNEVGSKPDRPLEHARARVHERNSARARDWPRAMLATNTHDTKRSADLRARLNVLTSMPDVWTRHVARWRRLNKPRKRVVSGKPAPDINSEYLYYQTLLGLWPAPRPQRRVDDLPDRGWMERARTRLVAYMLKAAREAKTRTSWTDGDAQYEKALDEYVRETLMPHEDAPFLGDVARLTALTADGGFRIALARILVHCLAPGVPDIYQGDELWNFSLVDPDNRRPVDFQQRTQLLDAIGPEVFRDALATGALSEDRVKLALVACLLRFRREHARLVNDGEYAPLDIGTPQGRDLFAFARRLDGDACIVLARTRPGAAAVTADQELPIPLSGELAGEWRSVLTERVIELVRDGPQLAMKVGDLVPSGQPCELLYRRQT